MVPKDLFEKAYDDLTTAVARAKFLCRKTNSPGRYTSNAPQLRKKRGRPKGSKNSKNRGKDKTSTGQQSESDQIAFVSDTFPNQTSCTCCTASSNLEHLIPASYDDKASSLGVDSDPGPVCSFCRMQHGRDLSLSSSSFGEVTIHDPQCWEFPIP
jgi:hypothetical protein